MDQRVWKSAVFTFLVALPGLAPPAGAAPYPVEMEPRLLLEVRPVGVAGGDTGSFEPREVEILPEAGGSLRLQLPWPDPLQPSRIDLHFSGTPSAQGPVHQIRVQASTVVDSGEPVVVDRLVAVEQDSMRFIEVYARGDRHLTLALKVEPVLRPVVLQPTGRDLPVEFRLAVGRVLPRGAVPLETDTLRTFIGQPVTYSFRRGQGDSLETVRLRLTPLGIQGDLLRLRIELHGEIRTGVSPLFLNRSETVLTGRSTSNDFQATGGEPPEGYRFTVTPVF